MKLNMTKCGIFQRLIWVILIPVCLPGQSFKVEKITSDSAWTSPLWGVNAPKIAVNKSGDIWVIGFKGNYPESEAMIFQKKSGTDWEKGYIFKGVYQPSMMFLDSDDILHIISNSQTKPIAQYRSADRANLNNFELVAQGNGQEDGRGWYVSVGISHDVLYMAYISLDYDLWLTWKSVNDSVWSPAQKLFDGFADPAGNHSLLYPKFYFDSGNGYILASHCSDGSTYNFKDKVFLIKFNLENPTEFISEIVYDGHKGYGAFGYDFLISSSGTLNCIYHAGAYFYGPKVSDYTKPGLYLSQKETGSETWNMQALYPSIGNAAIFNFNSDPIYLLISANDSIGINKTLLKTSEDNGKTWQTKIDNLFEQGQSPIFQMVNPSNGSAMEKMIALYAFSYPNEAKTKLSDYELGIIEFEKDGK